jgi:hypothetical protein
MATADCLHLSSTNAICSTQTYNLACFRNYRKNTHTKVLLSFMYSSNFVGMIEYSVISRPYCPYSTHGEIRNARNALFVILQGKRKLS